MPFEFVNYVFEALHIKSYHRCECNQCEALYVIATQVAYVIKPKKCTNGDAIHADA